MARVLAVGGVRFVLAGVLALALAACFVGRADAASVFSSPVASPSVFAQSSASAASVVASDRALTLKWGAVKGAAGYRVSWRGRVLKGGKPTAAWSAKWLGLKVLTASARSYKATGLVNGRQYQLRLESNTRVPVFADAYRLTLRIFALTQDFPREYKASLGADMKRHALVLLRSIYRIKKSPDKAAHLDNVLDDLELLKLEIRLAADLKVLSLKRQAELAELCDTVGKQIKGWPKKSRWVVKSTFVGSPKTTAPGAPTNVTGVVGDASVVVSWLAPSSDGGSAVTGYTVTADGGGSQTCTTATLSCSVAGLTNGTAYTFTVVATNARGNSASSAPSATVTPSAPPSCANGGFACVVGDTGPGGGKIFYAPGGTFTMTGAACGSSCRYLEAAPAGWNSGGSPDPVLRWGGGNGTAGHCSDKDTPGAAGTAIGSGFANTAAIMVACPDSSGNNSAPAALAASTYAPTVGGAVVTGWFMPSRDELNALDISSVGGLAPSVYYLSSSQGTAVRAWAQYVGNGGGANFQDVGYKNLTYRVRAVRAF